MIFETSQRPIKEAGLAFLVLVLAYIFTLLVPVAGHAAFTQVAAGVGMADAAFGYGAAWGDYDNDGDIDLFVANYLNAQDALYRNNGNGTFTNVAVSAGMVDASNGTGSAWGDYDGDGDLDLFVVNEGQQDFLYRNNGSGTFTQVATSVGMTDAGFGHGAAWGDYDADGDLDLFVANGAGQQDFLYQNNGAGMFSQVATTVGMTDGSDGFGAAWGDYDGDGDLDLVVVNNGNQQDFLYRNNGAGTFTQVAATAGMVDAVAGRGAAWGDYDADGDLDLYIVNAGVQDFLYRNNGAGTFTQVAASVGMSAPASNGVGAAWGDHDGDGDLDLFVANAGGQQDFLYRNNGDGTFTQVASSEGMTDGSEGIGTAWGDYDNDSDLDIFVANDALQQDFLYRNNLTGKNFIKVNPLTDANNNAVEADAQADRLAIGATVEIDLDGGSDFITGFGRYVSQLAGAGDGVGHSGIAVHLMVDTASTVDVRVIFPDGDVVVVPGVAVNQTVSVLDPGAAGPADTTPPVISNLVATPSILWPPNHRMVDVVVTASVQDNADPSPTLKIVSVVSSEPDDGIGDGHTTGDIDITGDLTVRLRAERNGKGIGRFYTITVEAEDATGNTSTATVTVTVPRSQK